jgi:hypothetical protein
VDYNSKKFKTLQAKWAKKLEKSGFNDIEDHDGHLKEYALSGYRRLEHQVSATNGDTSAVYNSINAKTEYYRLATHLLNQDVFKTDNEKYIWKLHSEGVSIRDIKAQVNAPNNYYIFNIIKRLKKEILRKKKHE